MMNDAEYRTRKFELIAEHLSSDGNDPRVEENEDRLLTLIMGGALPWCRREHPVGYSERWGVHSMYFLQVFFSTGADIVEGGWGSDRILRKQAEHERILDQGRGKPKATDGSKGQWRSYHKQVIKSCEWFRGMWDGTEWMEHTSELRYVPDRFK